MLDDLKSKLSASELTFSRQKEELSKTCCELKDSRSELLKMKKELANEKKAKMAVTKQLEAANKSLGTLAILAEDRKDERHALQRSVFQQKQALGSTNKDLEECSAQISSLTKELAEVKVSSEMTIRELQGSVNMNQLELQQAKNEIEDQKILLKSKVDELQVSEKQIYKLQCNVQDVESRAANLETGLQESQLHEKELQQTIEAQKIAYEQRLENIRDALGVGKKSGPSQFRKALELAPAIFSVSAANIKFV